MRIKTAFFWTAVVIVSIAAVLASDEYRRRDEVYVIQ